MIQLFRASARNRKPRSILGEIRISSPVSHTMWAAFSLSALLVTGLWMIFGEYSRKETARGVLLPLTGLSKLKARSAGEVTEINIVEGQSVKAGELLMVISGETQSEQTGALSRMEQKQLANNIANAEADITNEKYASEKQLNSLNKKIILMEEEMNAARSQLESYRDDYQSQSDLLSKYEQLVDERYVSGVQVAAQRSLVLQSKARIAQQQAELLSLNRNVIESRYDLSVLPVNSAKRLNEMELGLSNLRHSLNESYAKEKLSILATSDGVATNIAVKSGDTVMVGTPLVTVSPKNTNLIAEIYVPTTGVGFLKEGNRVALRYAAFPHQKFGVHFGEIVSIARSTADVGEVKSTLNLSDDKLANSYRVIVKLDSQHVKTNLGERPLLAGMEVEASITLENRAIYEWVFEPVLKVTSWGRKQ